MNLEEIKKIFVKGTVVNNSCLLNGRKVDNFTIPSDFKIVERENHRDFDCNVIEIRMNGGSETWTLYRTDINRMADIISHPNGYEPKIEINNYEIF